MVENIIIPNARLVVERPLMVLWVVGSIPHDRPISRSRQCSKIHITKAVICYPVYGMMHIKDILLLIGKSSPCSGGSGFPLVIYGKYNISFPLSDGLGK